MKKYLPSPQSSHSRQYRDYGMNVKQYIKHPSMRWKLNGCGTTYLGDHRESLKMEVWLKIRCIVLVELRGSKYQDFGLFEISMIVLKYS